MGETLVEIAVNSKDKKMIEMAIEKLKKCTSVMNQHSDCVLVKAKLSFKNDSWMKFTRPRKNYGILHLRNRPNAKRH